MPAAADLILSGGTVLTMDEGTPAASSLALRDGRVLAVGGEEVLSLRSDRTQLVALEGRTVCPGFIDAHHHLTLAAWCETGVDLGGCRSREEALTRIRAATPGPREWLYCFNYRPQLFGHGPGLNRHDLDEVAGERPVLAMHFTFHEAVVSSAGLRAAGIDRRTPDPDGGRVVRDRAGEPTGMLLERAAGRAEALARSSAASTGYADWLSSLQRCSRRLFAAGVTRVCDPGVDGMLEAYLRRAEAAGELPLPVSMLLVSQGGLFEPPWDRLHGAPTGERGERLEVGGLKLFADGGSRCAICVGLFESLAGVLALAGRAARLRRPGLLLASRTPDRPALGRDGRVRMGFLHYSQDELRLLCHRAHAQGFQVAVHAACNAAVENVIGAYQGLPSGRSRPRVEHLVSLDRAQAARLAASGAVGVVQPAYVTLLGDEWEAMPTPRRLSTVPLRTLLDAGMELAGSSDAPIAPFSPLLGMQAAVTRRTSGGLEHQPEQAITPLEALKLWTSGAALAANLADRAGRLRPGMAADLVVLSDNPLQTPPARWNEIRVERTLLAGRTVHLEKEAARDAQR